MKRIDLDAIDPAEIGRLMRLLVGTDVEEFEIEQGDLKISLKRSAEWASTPSEEPRAPGADHLLEEQAPVVSASAVGVFYRSEARADAAAIEEGAHVKTGDVLGVIEVMGVPHPVHSTRDGVIAAFLVEDGQPVEYGQPLVSYQSG